MVRGLLTAWGVVTVLIALFLAGGRDTMLGPLLHLKDSVVPYPNIPRLWRRMVWWKWPLYAVLVPGLFIGWVIRGCRVP